MALVGEGEIAGLSGPLPQMLAQSGQDHIRKRNLPRSVLLILDGTKHRLASHDSGKLTVDLHTRRRESTLSTVRPRVSEIRGTRRKIFLCAKSC